MLEIHFVRENPEGIKNDLRKRGALDKIPWVDEILVYDIEWRRILTEVNKLRSRRNEITREIRKLVEEEKTKEEILKMTKQELKDYKWSEELFESPMGISEWSNYGERYGYWNYYNDKIKNDLLKIADEGEYEDLRREVEKYFK